MPPHRNLEKTGRSAAKNTIKKPRIVVPTRTRTPAPEKPDPQPEVSVPSPTGKPKRGYRNGVHYSTHLKMEIERLTKSEAELLQRVAQLQTEQATLQADKDRAEAMLLSMLAQRDEQACGSVTNPPAIRNAQRSGTSRAGMSQNMKKKQSKSDKDSDRKHGRSSTPDPLSLGYESPLTPRTSTTIPSDEEELVAIHQTMTHANSKKASEHAGPQVRSAMAIHIQTQVDARRREKQHHTLALGLGTEQMGVRAYAWPLDVEIFYNTADRESERKLMGRVQILNSSIDDFTMEVIEKARKIVSLRSLDAGDPRVKLRESNDGFPRLTNEMHRVLLEKKGKPKEQALLLEYILHAEVVRALDELLFSGMLVPPSLAAGDSKSLNQVYSQLLAQESSWPVVQRWRSMTVACIFEPIVDPQSPLNQERHQTLVEQRIQEISELFAVAFGAPSSAFASSLAQSGARLGRIYDEAIDVALASRRDMISGHANLVSYDPMLAGRALRFDSNTMCSPWGAKATEGEFVVGPYRFGLAKTTADGSMRWMIKATVMTQSVLKNTCNLDGETQK
ncbi:hypothetical protein HMN09_01204400 [Mycena chlorophos]|uniref:Uncharacterized protein n=1 Tax=Mycena chlorophos TaxID=658473 RepID=A0A8H6S8J5_MYCCL|nr:hypothetical protein HMN09_01204400 [Mycena chlorophos]